MFFIVLLVTSVLACRENRLPKLTLEAEPPSLPVGGVRILHVESDIDVSVTIEIQDGLLDRRLLSSALSRSHALPVIGLPAEIETTLQIEAIPAEGEPVHAELVLQGDSLPERFPRIEVLAADPLRMEPGYTLFVVRSPVEKADPIVILDALARPVWWYEPARGFGDLRMTESGTLLALAGGDIVEIDLLGEERLSLDVEGEDLHREVFPLEEGGWLSPRTRPFPVEAYPTDALDPLGPTAPAVLDDHEVLKIAPDGTVLSALSMAERLDTMRVSLESLQPAQLGRKDWVHVNAVIPDPRDGGILVSLRHQDAVIKLDAQGELQWILGDPAGWRSPWAEKLLTPSGSFSWPYHQHAIELQPDGLLVMFDNHNHGGTLYEPPPEGEPHSRVVAFHIDEQARTVTFAWELCQTSTGPLFSGANGDADVQPLTGNVLADYGMVNTEDGVPNEEMGMGKRTVRFVEWDPADPLHPVMDLRLWGPLDEEPEGWQAFRVERIESLDF
jgi:arylsulfate sulfotransferase